MDTFIDTPDPAEAAPDGAEAQELAAFLGPDTTAPDSLTAYQFPYGPDAAGMTPAQQAQDGEARQWLADADMPASVGGTLAKIAVEHAARLAREPEATPELAAKQCESQVRAIFKEQTDEMVAYARALVSEVDLKHGGRVVDFLAATNLGNCAPLIVQLALFAQKRALAQKGRK
ncbi:hypothetical protein BURK2_02154 [Burkholderiales bacterium]|nr:hypothetical protein BURK2_02154 [Burkholderiales bacterium]